jgi:hypothetical protein
VFFSFILWIASFHIEGCGKTNRIRQKFFRQINPCNFVSGRGMPQRSGKSLLGQISHCIITFNSVIHLQGCFFSFGNVVGGSCLSAWTLQSSMFVSVYLTAIFQLPKLCLEWSWYILKYYTDIVLGGGGGSQNTANIVLWEEIWTHCQPNTMVGFVECYNRKVFVIKGPNDCLEALAVYTATILTFQSTSIYSSVPPRLRFFLSFFLSSSLFSPFIQCIFCYPPAFFCLDPCTVIGGCIEVKRKKYVSYTCPPPSSRIRRSEPRVFGRYSENIWASQGITSPAGSVEISAALRNSKRLQILTVATSEDMTLKVYLELNEVRRWTRNDCFSFPASRDGGKPQCRESRHELLL